MTTQPEALRAAAYLTENVPGLFIGVSDKGSVSATAWDMDALVRLAAFLGTTIKSTDYRGRVHHRIGTQVLGSTKVSFFGSYVTPAEPAA